MIPQLHFDVTEAPPVVPQAGEPALFDKESPQRERVQALLGAAAEAADAFEFDGLHAAASWRLRVALSESDPDGRLKHPSYGLSAAAAIAQVIALEGRNKSKEAHLGPLAKFALIAAEEAIGHVLVDAQEQRGLFGGSGYHVSLVSEGSAEPLTIPRNDGWEEEVRWSRRPVAPPDEARSFLSYIAAASTHHLTSKVMFHMNRAGGWFEFSGDAFKGHERRFGPVEIWMGDRLPLSQPASIRIERHDLHSLSLALRGGACGTIWPPIIEVNPPTMRGDIRVMVGTFAEVRHTHMVTTFTSEAVRWGEEAWDWAESRLAPTEGLASDPDDPEEEE